MTHEYISTEEELQEIRRALERIADCLEEKQRPIIVTYSGKLDAEMAHKIKDAIRDARINPSRPLE